MGCILRFLFTIFNASCMRRKFLCLQSFNYILPFAFLLSYPLLCFGFFLAMKVWYKSLPKSPAVLLDHLGQSGVFLSEYLNEAKLWVSSLCPAMVKHSMVPCS